MPVRMDSLRLGVEGGFRLPEQSTGWRSPREPGTFDEEGSQQATPHNEDLEAWENLIWILQEKMPPPGVFLDTNVVRSRRGGSYAILVPTETEFAGDEANFFVRILNKHVEEIGAAQHLDAAMRVHGRAREKIADHLRDTVDSEVVLRVVRERYRNLGNEESLLFAVDVLAGQGLTASRAFKQLIWEDAFEVEYFLELILKDSVFWEWPFLQMMATSKHIDVRRRLLEAVDEIGLDSARRRVLGLLSRDAEVEIAEEASDRIAAG